MEQTPTEIEQLEERLRRAMLTADVATLDALLASDVLFTDASGHVLTKAADLEMHRSGRLRLTSLEASDRRIRVEGPVAGVTLRMAIAGAFDGQAFATALRYTRVWQRSPAGDWTIVAAHGGPAPAMPAPDPRPEP